MKETIQLYPPLLRASGTKFPLDSLTDSKNQKPTQLFFLVFLERNFVLPEPCQGQAYLSGISAVEDFAIYPAKGLRRVLGKQNQKTTRLIFLHNFFLRFCAWLCARCVEAPGASSMGFWGVWDTPLTSTLSYPPLWRL